MYLSYFDDSSVTETLLTKHKKALTSYRESVAKVVAENDATAPEFSLVYAKDAALHDTLATLTKQFKGISHLILVGIGGSSLGVEAVHQVLNTGKVSLMTLDTVSASSLQLVISNLRTVRSVKKIAVCIVSKSGGTAETLTNASVLLDALKAQYGDSVYTQTIFIGDAGTEFMKAGKRLGVTTVAMPSVIGGRFSMATAVGLVPLALLGHDVDAFIDGFLDASGEEFESVVLESAPRLFAYLQKGYPHYNFFAFETRLERLGAWYRQLQAESLGKAADASGKAVTKAFVPTISTAVELHSVGQLYLSGVTKVYTDFVTFDDDSIDYTVAKKGFAKQYGGFTIQEVATAIYGGVIAAYQEQGLPYRTTILTDELPYALGLFMSMRMRETMYVAHLLGVNAFDQPNVELYKQKTRAILAV